MGDNHQDAVTSGRSWFARVFSTPKHLEPNRDAMEQKRQRNKIELDALIAECNAELPAEHQIRK